MVLPPGEDGFKEAVAITSQAQYEAGAMTEKRSLELSIKEMHRQTAGLLPR